MNLERSLVLNRYLHGLLGAERFDDLRIIEYEARLAKNCGTEP